MKVKIYDFIFILKKTIMITSGDIKKKTFWMCLWK